MCIFAAFCNAVTLYARYIMIELLEKQREYFATGATLPAKARVAALKKLKDVILAREKDINEALKADLGKGGFESYMCEVGMTLSEL